jgi:hypothetical protein
MAFQKVEFEFPHENEENDDDVKIEVERSSALEVDIGGRKAKREVAEAAEAATSPRSEPEEADSDDDSDYSLEVIDDTPKADRGRKPSEPPVDVTDEELEEYSDKVRKRIKHFSKGYHDERRAKEQALRERQELESLAQRLVNENKELRSNVGKNQAALLEQAKRVAENELEAAKRRYKEAYEAGDSEGVVAAQDSLTTAKIKSDKLNNFEMPSLQDDNSPDNMSFETAPQRVQVDPKAEAWKQANPWFNQDHEMTSLAMGLHTKLVQDGLDPRSDEYYERIDARMRQLFPERFEDTQEEEDRPKRRSNVVAPATRSTAPKKIRLTQTQVTLAKRLGLSPEQYAKQVALDMRKQNG